MITLIFLAGGTGSRIGARVPKQYLPLEGKPLALHSFDILRRVPEITEIIIVCEPEHQSYFTYPVLFATPGPRRQDSVYSGLMKSSQEIIFIHDSARPFVEAKYIPPLLEAVRTSGAAALAIPATNTIKECTSNHHVEKTLDRTRLWEMQTPQGIRREILIKAFDYVQKNNLEVTDDLSMVEAIGLPTKIVPSSPRNFKITTPFDFEVAKKLCATN